MMRFLQEILCVLMAVLLCGCSLEKAEEAKIRDIEFTETKEEELPEEVKKMIAEKEGGPFRITYGDQEFLYIGRCYGRQSEEGYHIEMDECYETEHSITVHTNLIGPKGGKPEDTKEGRSPYLVVQIEWTNKQVIFK